MSNVGEHSRELKVGMKCPQCGTFIETSIFELLTTKNLECPSCHLCCSRDSKKSKPALEVLRKLQEVQRNVEKKDDSTK